MGPIQVLITDVLEHKYSKIRMSYQELDADIGCVYLSGRLDVRTVPHIEEKFFAKTSGDNKSVIVDLSGVELMNSVGLGMLISSANALRASGKTMVILNPRPNVERVVRIACVEQLLPIVHGMVEALRRIRAN